MKKLKKTVLLLLLAAVLLLPGRAAEVTFTSVNNTLLPLSDDSMPTLYGGTVYLPYSIFNSLDLGTYAVYSPTSQKVTVFTEKDQLIFDLIHGGAVDKDEVSYTNSAISLNGRVYLPVDFTSRHFGITYTTINTSYGPILRLKTRSGYDDQTFASAAAILLQSRLDEYNASLAPQEPPEEEAGPIPSQPESGETELEEQTPEPTESGGQQTAQPWPQQPPSPPEPEEPSQPPAPPAPDHSDVEVYLSFYGLDQALTPRILDVLEENGTAACFFLPAEDIAAWPDLVRRICGSGHSVGILCGDEPEAEYEEASALLYEAAHCSSFLLSALPAEEERAFPEGPVLYRPGSGASVPADCKVLLRAAGERADLPLLTDRENAEGLGSLLKTLREENYNVQLLTESRAAALPPREERTGGQTDDE